MTKDEALRLAWDALEDIGDEWGFTSQRTVPKRKEAITAIKEALAQPEPNYKKALEVWLDKTEWVQETVKPHELGMHRADVLKQRIEATLAQPEQDVGIIRYADISVGKIIHNSSPPQRTWVGLTRMELIKCGVLPFGMSYELYEAIEQALKERNT